MNPESKVLSGAYFDRELNGNKQLKDITKVVIGALSGAAVGFLVAGAFTKKGEEIRHRIGDSSRDLANNLKHKVSYMKDALTDKLEAAKEGVADLIEKAKQKIGFLSRSVSAGNPAYAGSPSYSGNGNAGHPPYAGDSLYTGNKDYSDEAEGMSTGKKIVLGELIASVAGAVIWSFATEKGKSTRKSMAKSSKKIVNNIKEKAAHVKEVVADTYKTAREGANDLLAQEQQRIHSDQ